MPSGFWDHQLSVPSCPHEMFVPPQAAFRFRRNQLRTSSSHVNVGFTVNLPGPHTGRLWLGDLDRGPGLRQCWSSHSLLFGKPDLCDPKKKTRGQGGRAYIPLWGLPRRIPISHPANVLVMEAKADEKLCPRTHHWSQN